MTTGAGDPIFVDANVLVYASVLSAPLHQAAAQVVGGLFATGDEVWISRQVLREYLATLTRPQTFVKPQPVTTLGRAVRAFERRFRVAEDTAGVTERLLDLMSQVEVGGKRVHDANIVATMQVHGIGRLLTHNTTDFRRFAGLITVVPLVPTDGT